MNCNGTARISISIELTSPVTWSTLSFRRSVVDDAHLSQWARRRSAHPRATTTARRTAPATNSNALLQRVKGLRETGSGLPGRLRLADQRANSAINRAPNSVRVGNPPSIHIRSVAVMYTCSVRAVTPIPLPSAAACGANPPADASAPAQASSQLPTTAGAATLT
jgi:hypothetical protein